MPVPMRTLIYGRLLLLVAAIVALGLVVGRHMAVSWNVVLAVMGFSAVVFIHECGHFLVAKAVGIKVEVFSIFIPPILLGIRRTEAGYRVRILPRFFRTEDDPEGDGLLSFTLARQASRVRPNTASAWCLWPDTSRCSVRTTWARTSRSKTRGHSAIGRSWPAWP